MCGTNTSSDSQEPYMPYLWVTSVLTMIADAVYMSAVAESLSLKYYSFGLDVIAAIGNMRFNENKTIGEIHSELLKSVSISEREIQYEVNPIFWTENRAY